MPEEGMVEVGELKIHQASHARYFEDFLKFVEYERSMPEIMKTQVMDMVYDQIEDVFEEGTEDANNSTKRWKYGLPVRNAKLWNNFQPKK